MWYSIAGMLSASFGASMLPIAKFAWEKLEFLLAPSQEREKQQQVYPCFEMLTGIRSQCTSAPRAMERLDSLSLPAWQEIGLS